MLVDLLFEIIMAYWCITQLCESVIKALLPTQNYVEDGLLCGSFARGELCQNEVVRQKCIQWVVEMTE